MFRLSTWVVSIFSIAVLATSHPVNALTFRAVEVECPIDGTKFESHVMASGTAFCQRIDGRLVGPIADPPPLHECPEDGFVWRPDGDDGAEALKLLRPWVLSEAYQSEIRPESSYFRLARIQQRLGHHERAISRSFLRAAWNVELLDRGRYLRNLALSHKHLTRHLEAASSVRQPTSQLATDEILAGELERQLGHLERAHGRFDRLMRADLNDQQKRVVDFELELIESRNRFPQYAEGSGSCEHSPYSEGAEVRLADALTATDQICASYRAGVEEDRVRIEEFDTLTRWPTHLEECRRLRIYAKQLHRERCSDVSGRPDSTALWKDIDAGRVRNDMTRCALLAAWGKPSRLRVPIGEGCQLWTYERKTGAPQLVWLAESDGYVSGCGPSSPNGPALPEVAQSTIVCGPPPPLLTQYDTAPPSRDQNSCEALAR